MDQKALKFNPIISENDGFWRLGCQQNKQYKYKANIKIGSWCLLWYYLFVSYTISLLFCKEILSWFLTRGAGVRILIGAREPSSWESEHALEMHVYFFIISIIVWWNKKCKNQTMFDTLVGSSGSILLKVNWNWANKVNFDMLIR